MKEKLLRLALIPLTAVLLVASGCTSSMTTTTGTQSNATGPAFLVGTDAPLAGVVSFQVQIESVELTNSGGSAGMLVGTPTVDFARFNGLQTLVDMNDVTNGTYTGVKITLGSASLSYLNTTNSPPTITTLNSGSTPALSLSSTTLTIPLTDPLVISHGSQPVGLRMDFDLAQSIPVDGSGNIVVSGGEVTVTPTIDVSTVARQDSGAHIDTFIGGVVTPPTETTEPASFVIAGPHGENFTINTTSSTQWDSCTSACLSALNTDSIVEVAGTMDPADQNLDADEVAIISDKNFYATGQITYVNPTAGTAGEFDLYVRALEPQGVPISLGQLAQVNLTGTEKYYVYSLRNPLTEFFFNGPSNLVAGQDVAVGGPDTGVVSESNVTVDRIHLRNWGFNGTIVPGSIGSAGNGTFKMQVTGFAGVLIPEQVTVVLGGNCDFRYGLGESGFGGLTDSAKIRVVGLLLNNNGQVILWARHIDGTDHTDFTTAAWE